MVGTLCMDDTRSSRCRYGHAMWLDDPHGIARAWRRRRGASLGVAEDSQNLANALRCAEAFIHGILVLATLEHRVDKKRRLRHVVQRRGLRWSAHHGRW